MANTFKIYEDLQDAFSEQQARILTKVISQTIIDESNIVTKVEFNRLEGIVEELAEAQKRTEARVEELAEAQKKTEQRLDSLTQRVEELAEAQKKTEQRLDSLTQRVEELAEAQKKTEETVRQLVVDMADVKKQLGGLSMAVGYGIEDKYIPFMKKFALNQYNAVISKVERKNVKYANGSYDEVNLYLEGKINGKKTYIIGESKAQPGKKDIDKFDLMLKRLKKHLDAEVKGFMIGYVYAPEVEDYFAEKYPHIDFFKTYQIEEIAGSSK